MAKRNLRKNQGKKTSKADKLKREKRKLFAYLCLVVLAVLLVYISWQKNYSGLSKQNVLRTVESQGSKGDKSGLLPEGLSVAGLSIGKLTVDQAVDLIRQNIDQIRQAETAFFYQDREVRVSGAELGVELVTGELRRRLEGLLAEGAEAKLYLPLTPSDQGLNKVIEKLSINFNQKAEDARQGEFNPNTNRFEVVPAQTGLELIREDLVRDLKGRLLDKGMEDRIELSLAAVEPEIKTEEIKDEFYFLARSSTNIPYYDANRIHNLITSCQKINGSVVYPGDTYSFMGVMGDFKPGDGWVNAGMQSDGVTVSGLGGGICQTSTTLFQAAVLAGLDIIEAHNHDLPSDYCNLGEDAMVAYGWSDLRVRNGLSGPIKLVAYYADPAVIIEIYGPERKPSITTQLFVEFLGKIEPGPDEERIKKTLEPGQTEVYRRRSDGYKTRLYRLWLENGQEYQRDLITSYVYPAFSGIYYVGEKQEKPEEPKESEEPSVSYIFPETRVNDYGYGTGWTNYKDGE